MIVVLRLLALRVKGVRAVLAELEDSIPAAARLEVVANPNFTAREAKYTVSHLTSASADVQE